MPCIVMTTPGMEPHETGLELASAETWRHRMFSRSSGSPIHIATPRAWITLTSILFLAGDVESAVTMPRSS